MTIRRRRLTSSAPFMACLAATALAAAACDAPTADVDHASQPIERYAPDSPREVRQLTIGGDTVVYEVVKGLAILDGDIILGPVDEFEEQLSQPDNAYSVFKTGQRWPSTIRYTFDNDTPAATKLAVEEAMQKIVDQSCADISFKRCRGFCPLPRIKFRYDGDGCASSVGRQLFGNKIELDTWCDGIGTSSEGQRRREVGTIMHELMHALGVQHEQTRCDRDNHVTINPDNVDTDVCGLHNLTPKHCFLHDDFSSYDFSSIMHYASNACAIDSSMPTIDSGNATTNAMMGNRTGLSSTDGAALRHMYGTNYGCAGGGSTGSGSSGSSGSGCNPPQCVPEQ